MISIHILAVLAALCCVVALGSLMLALFGNRLARFFLTTKHFSLIMQMPTKNLSTRGVSTRGVSTREVSTRGVSTRADFKERTRNFSIHQKEKGWYGYGISGAIVWLGCLFSMPRFAVVLMALFVVLVGVYRLKTLWQKQRHKARLAKHFPEALEHMTRSLNVGLSLEASLRATKENCHDAIGQTLQEFQKMLHWGSGHTPLLTATLKDAGEDVHLFAHVLLLHKEVGSSLVPIFQELSSTLRARSQIQRKIQSLGRKGVLTVRFLLILPFLTLLGIGLLSPEHVAILYQTYHGRLVSLYALVSLFVGFVLVHYLSRQRFS